MNAEEESGYQRPHQHLTQTVIGAAMEISRGLGSGFLERVYENALIHELQKRGLRVERQKVVDVRWDGVLVGTNQLDLLVDEVLVVELKACSCLTDQHMAQTVNHLRATDQRLALLLNFGTPRLQVKRLINSQR